MQVNDLVVTGDARILGNLYTKDGNVSGGSGGSGSGDSGITYKLSKSGSTITLTGSDGSTSSVTDANTDTNTTYSNATTSAAGLMSASDKSKLDGITASADSVSFSRSLSSGTKIGTITINGTGTDLYCQTNTDTNTTYSAGTGISLSGTTFSNSGVRSIATGGSNGTISVNTNGSTANVAVKGLGSAAYTDANAYLAAKGQSAYDCNTCYDGGLYMIANGKNYPSGSPYGTLLVLPYRENVGNTQQDFAVQIFIPNGDDSTRPNSMFYRTSIKNSWAHWNEVSTTSHTHSYAASSHTHNDLKPFVATYGSTTFSEIKAASDAGRMVILTKMDLSGYFGISSSISVTVAGSVTSDKAIFHYVWLFTNGSVIYAENTVDSNNRWTSSAGCTPSLNRTTHLNASDTNYTKLMARGTSLNSSTTNPDVNGAIAWTYA